MEKWVGKIDRINMRMGVGYDTDFRRYDAVEGIDQDKLKEESKELSGLVLSHAQKKQ